MPGEIAFTRTGPSSRAIAFTNPSRPQFTMLVTELFGAGRAPRMPEKNVNEPSAAMRGAPCFTRKIGAHKLRLHCRADVVRAQLDDWAGHAGADRADEMIERADRLEKRLDIFLA